MLIKRIAIMLQKIQNRTCVVINSCSKSNKIKIEKSLKASKEVQHVFKYDFVSLVLHNSYY